MTASTDRGARSGAAEQPRLQAFVIVHKCFSITVLALIVAFVAIVLPAVLGSGPLSDSSSCSTWSSAAHSRQAAYARLYLSEHRALPSGATSLASVESAINDGCTAASAYDQADTVSVAQAIDGRY